MYHEWVFRSILETCYKNCSIYKYQNKSHLKGLMINGLHHNYWTIYVSYLKNLKISLETVHSSIIKNGSIIFDIINGHCSLILWFEWSSQKDINKCCFSFSLRRWHLFQEINYTPSKTDNQVDDNASTIDALHSNNVVNLHFPCYSIAL